MTKSILDNGCSNCLIQRSAHISGVLGRFWNIVQYWSLTLVAIFALSACQSAPGGGVIDLMPAPDLYADGTLDHLIPEQDPLLSVPYNGILYATDRAPNSAEAIAAGGPFYLDERGFVLRLGVGRVSVKHTGMNWEEARRVSLLKNRSSAYPIAVSQVEEFGVLESSATPLLDDHLRAGSDPQGQQRFSENINVQLRNSDAQDVYVYVHGYKVDFSNPLLVATELWHFLGYSGAFVAYAWPSTPSTTAYVRDIDTAAGFARNFRVFLEYLAKETNAQRIHVLGYSAGTRLVTRTFEQMAIATGHMTPEEIRERYRIGNLILVGSDVDRSVFGEYLADGLLDIPQQTSVYMSDKDKALGMSSFLTNNARLGQLWDPKTIPAGTRQYLQENPRLQLINVSQAEGSDAGNGHGYFRNSPWVSSDVLLQLAYNLDAEQRGLVRDEDSPLWEFPQNYIERVHDLIQLLRAGSIDNRNP